MRLNRAGFTLIELLVAMMISGVLATVMFQLLSGQGRFVELQSAREEVQQNSRAALDIIGNDLRTLPIGGSLVSADQNSVTFRTIRIWGVVCAIGTGNTLNLSLPALAGVSYDLNPGTGLVALVDSAGTLGSTNAVAVSSIAAAASTCNGNALGGNAEARTITLASIPQNPNPAVSLSVGDVAYLYDQVTYEVGSPAAVPGLWIQRRQGEGPASITMPMAGPIQNANGLAFQYFVGSSTTPVATPVASATLDAITRVQVAVEAVSRNTAGGSQASKSDTVVITLRNRL